MNPLPPAHLRPQNVADRKAILRGHAVTGARRVGRFTWALTKVGVVIGLVALVAAIGSRRGRYQNPDFDRASERLRRMSESLRTIQNMPKIDLSKLDFRLRPSSFAPSFDRELDLSTPFEVELDRDLSPSQQRAAATTSSP